jgi:nicotinamide-nucleotide amidase
MQAILLSIGDELTLGQTLDTNSAWLAQQLTAIGYKPVAHLTVPDDHQAIQTAIEESVGRCDALIISGGLGPTEDDLTRHALAAFLNQPLELVPEALKNVERFFRLLKREMPERNKIQAMLPRGADIIENTAGTAPGIYCNYQSGDQKTLCQIFIMPGVPKEMKTMFARDILPKLKQQEASQGQIILSKTLHTFGLGESAVAEKIPDLMRRDRNPSVGTTVSNGYVSLRINAYYNSREEAEEQLKQTEQLARTALGDLIWGADDETLPLVVARLFHCGLPALPIGAPLQPFRVRTVATAESCTGGLVAKYLTDASGSSEYFKRGWITYSNEAKTELLGVKIGPEGAVSEDTVAQMAQGAIRLAGADYALAISGIAGPNGGTPAKPVGTVCIALASADGISATSTDARTFLFPGDREMIRDRSAKTALTMLRYHLLNKPLPF